MSNHDFDLFVIGGGSGGVCRPSCRADGQEGGPCGGVPPRTCVNRGCVPKKLLVYASQFSEHFEDAAGWLASGDTRFDWPTLIANKDREIARLEGCTGKGWRMQAPPSSSSRRAVDAHTVRLAMAGSSPPSGS